MSNITQYTYKELFEIRYWKGSFDESECYFGIIKFIPLSIDIYNPQYGMYELKKIKVKAKLEELCDNYNTIFRTWFAENDFEFVSPEDAKLRKEQIDDFEYYKIYGEDRPLNHWSRNNGK